MHLGKVEKLKEIQKNLQFEVTDYPTGGATSYNKSITEVERIEKDSLKGFLFAYS